MRIVAGPARQARAGKTKKGRLILLDGRPLGAMSRSRSAKSPGSVHRTLRARRLAAGSGRGGTRGGMDEHECVKSVHGTGLQSRACRAPSRARMAKSRETKEAGASLSMAHRSASASAAASSPSTPRRRTACRRRSRRKIKLPARAPKSAPGRQRPDPGQGSTGASRPEAASRETRASPAVLAE